MSINWASINWFSLGLNNIALAMFVLAIVLFLFEWIIQTFRGRAGAYEILYHWIAVFPLGVTALYDFIFNAIFPKLIADSMGWQMSPFQYDVAIANLSIGIIAISSFRENYGFRLATVIASTIWLWGQAIGYINQMVLNKQYGLANIDSWFWVDLIIPIILIVCIRKLRPVVVETYSPTIQSP